MKWSKQTLRVFLLTNKSGCHQVDPLITLEALWYLRELILQSLVKPYTLSTLLSTSAVLQICINNIV
jgi:hypothetical protein